MIKQSGKEWPGKPVGCGECVRVHWYTTSEIQEASDGVRPCTSGAMAAPPQTLLATVVQGTDKKKSENRGTRSLLSKILGPLLKVVFSEKAGMNG